MSRSRFSITNRSVGANASSSGAELLANQDKIKAMFTAKVIREGRGPYPAIKIFDKIIGNIPTLKADL